MNTALSKSPLARALVSGFAALLPLFFLASCASPLAVAPDPFNVPSLSPVNVSLRPLVSSLSQRTPRSEIVVSVKDQTLALFKDGRCVATHPVSTSKFGIGSTDGSYRTPVGRMVIAEKVGDKAPHGAVFKGRVRTGQFVRPNAPGRDPIVTRILRLKGLDSGNRNTHARCIYIHGTPEERNIGRPASYGCVRMTSTDVVSLYRQVDVGTEITIDPESLTSAIYSMVERRRGTSNPTRALVAGL